MAIAWRRPAFHSFLQTRRTLLRNVLLILLAGVAALLWTLCHPAGFVTLTIGLTWLAMFYACLLVFVLTEKASSVAAAMRWRWLRNLGLISYCVYIVHDAINQIAHRLIFHHEPQLHNLADLAVTVIALAVTLSLALISWAYFESPLIRRGHKYSFGNAVPSQPSLSPIPHAAPGVTLPTTAPENPYTIN